MCFACAIIYSGILGDIFTQLLNGVLSPSLNNRGTNIIVATLTVLLPLSLLKDLSSLAFTSILGFCSIVYTVAFMMFRYLDGSYSVARGGKFVTGEAAAAMAAMPDFANLSLWKVDFTSLVLASNLGLAFIAHYNGPVFYRELENNTMPRFKRMVSTSFTILALLYMCTMLGGVYTFGEACAGNILLNYHPSDVLSILAKVATALSILFGYPLVMCGLKEGFVGAAESCGFNKVGTDAYHFPVVASFITVITTIAILVEDISLVVGITGAAMGSLIVYIIPAIIYVSAVKKTHGVKSVEYSKSKKVLALVPFGASIGILGVTMTIVEALKKS
jgi:amino acid permease